MRRASYTTHVVPVANYRRIPFAPVQPDLVPLLDGALDRLEQDPPFAFFTLDGCAGLLEDYLTLRPEYFERVERSVQVGRLLVGPWYVRPVATQASPEPMIRNLLIGLRTARVFGTPMPVGWLPDAERLPVALPQILRGFGIQGAIGPTDHPQCWWQGDDGSRVLLCAPTRIEKGERGAVGDLLTIQPWTEPIPRATPPDETRVSNPALYLRAIERHARSHEIPVWDVHDHQPLKPDPLADMLTTRLEPYSVLESYNNPHIPRPQALLRKLWQEALHLSVDGFGESGRTAHLMQLIARLSPEESQLERVICASDGKFEITAVKLPEESERGGFIVRGRNIDGETIPVTLTPWRRFAVCEVVMLDEQPTGGTLGVDTDGAIHFRAAPQRLLTFWFRD